MIRINQGFVIFEKNRFWGLGMAAEGLFTTALKI
jgi:hypothetical protein